jgi:hypothetical protein
MSAGTELGIPFFTLLPLFIFSLYIKGGHFVLISVMLATVKDVRKPLDTIASPSYNVV